MHFGKEAYFSHACSLGFVPSFLLCCLPRGWLRTDHVTKFQFKISHCTAFYHTFLLEVNLTKKHLMFFIMEKGGWSSWDFRVVMSIYVKQLPKSLFNWWEKHTHIEKTRRNNEIMTFCRTVDSVNLLYRINWYQRPIKCCKGSMFCLESASFSFANDGLRIRAEASVAPFQAIIKGKM